MADEKPQQPKPDELLTRDEVIAELLREIDRDTLTVVAQRYKISLSQLSDIVHGRANLSTKALDKLRWELIKFYRKVRD